MDDELGRFHRDFARAFGENDEPALETFYHDEVAVEREGAGVAMLDRTALRAELLGRRGAEGRAGVVARYLRLRQSVRLADAAGFGVASDWRCFDRRGLPVREGRMLQRVRVLDGRLRIVFEAMREGSFQPVAHAARLGIWAQATPAAR